jgi:chitinase
MSARSNLEPLEQRRLFNGLPAVYIGDASVTEGNSGTKTAEIVISLTQSRPRQSVTVNYSTQNGAAIAGQDYQATSGKLTFAAGELSKTIKIPLLGDRLVESDESFTVNLQGVKNAKVADGQGLVTIADDEPRIFINDVSAPEGNAPGTPFVFTAFLTTPYDVPVTVNYATSDGSATAGSDYTAATGTLTFPAGETRQTVTVLVNGDHAIESNENFVVNLSSPSAYAEVIRGVGYGTIVDDEPRISVSDAYYFGDTSPFTFAVTLSAPSDQVVTVDFATVDGTAVAGTHYVATAGTLTFNPGEPTTQFVSVQVLDPTLEPDKYFYLHLTGSTNAPLVNDYAYGFWYYDYGYYDGGGYYDPGYYYY